MVHIIKIAFGVISGQLVEGGNPVMAFSLPGTISILQFGGLVEGRLDG
jgi:hypothetical protein